MNAQDKDTAYAQAVAQAVSIENMVGALNCDYDRLEELREELENLKEEYDEAVQESDEARAKVAKEIEEWNEANAEELAELEASSNGNKDYNSACEAVQNDALDVQVRSDWHAPGGDNTPSEFSILLCTGGPAVRIRGELNDYSKPCRAWIEYQDWFQPWQEAVGIIDQPTLLTYCQQFYFGE